VSDRSAATGAYDVIVVGAGAAGLATAIFARRFNPDLRVLLLDGARNPGAKILVSGGSRCNVTNRSVAEQDFWGGRRTIIRGVLRAFTAADTLAWFADLGVPLHEEPGGKIFPDSNQSRDVLDALLREAAARGAELLAGHRVTAVDRQDGRFVLDTSRGVYTAPSIVVAAGGGRSEQAATAPPTTSCSGWATPSSRRRPRSCRWCWTRARRFIVMCRACPRT
jgi:predicted Rossmann fold flavoprotein